MIKIKGKQLIDNTITQAKLNLVYPVYSYDAATKEYVDEFTVSAVTLNTVQTISGTKTFSNVVYMLNGLYVSGTTTYVNTQNLNIADNYILINSGETGSGVTLGIAGIEVDRGYYPRYGFYFDESTDTFRVGMTGETQAVATREDNPLDGYIPVWNSALTMFVTSINTTSLLTGNTGNFVETGSTVLMITGGTGAVIGAGITIQMQAASATTSGYLTSNDYNDIYNQIRIAKSLALFGVIA